MLIPFPLPHSVFFIHGTPFLPSRGDSDHKQRDQHDQRTQPNHMKSQSQHPTKKEKNKDEKRSESANKHEDDDDSRGNNQTKKKEEASRSDN